MKKKMFLFGVLLVTSSFLFATEAKTQEPKLMMPPPVPSIDAKATLPKECEAIPPMIYKLPPPLEAMVGECRSALYKPNVKAVEKIFAGAKDIEIEILKGFDKLYRISFSLNGKKISKYCNSELNCLE